MVRPNGPSTRWRHHLPGFDPIVQVFVQRRATANALRYLGWEHGHVRDCTAAAPCRDGLCARCARQLRSNLLGFLSTERLDERSWHFVTIRPHRWTMRAGDRRPFGRLRDHHLIENLTTRFRRMGLPGLIVFGSIETVWHSIGNRPAGKPFHLHLMIAGATADQIRDAVWSTMPLNGRDVEPLNIQPVGRTPADFFAAASYAFKQPLLKKSRVAAEATGVAQSLKPAERRELILNLGVHGWAGRLILLGVRCDSGRFRLTADLSATT